MRVVGACVRRVAATAVVLSPLVAVAPLSAPSAAAAFDCSSGAAGYAVRSGDGWFSIASRAEVSVRSLLDANGASTDDALHPGDRLCLPGDANLTAVCPATSTVRPGDGWGSIAERSGVSVAAVLASNGADVDRMLHPGDVVCLPEGATAERSSDSSSDGSSDSSAGGSSGGGQSAGAGYTIARGDSWFGIAERTATTVRALLEVNRASADEPIHPGQEIVLPEGATTPAAGASGSGWATLEALPTQGPCWYADSWGHGRSGGRRHVGVDIFTVSREYVYAVADGRLTMRKWEQPGNISGNAWRLAADDGTVYFYAHLYDFAPGLGEGSRVEAGQIIGWVGATGNTSVDHVHFEIRPGGGEPVNPYPILQAHGGACNQGTPYSQPGGWIPD